MVLILCCTNFLFLLRKPLGKQAAASCTYKTGFVFQTLNFGVKNLLDFQAIGETKHIAKGSCRSQFLPLQMPPGFHTLKNKVLQIGKRLSALIAYIASSCANAFRHRGLVAHENTITTPKSQGIRRHISALYPPNKGIPLQVAILCTSHTKALTKAREPIL